MEEKEIEAYDFYMLQDVLETFYNIHSSSIDCDELDHFAIEYGQKEARLFLEKYCWKNGTPKCMREPYGWEKQSYERLKNGKED